MAIGTYGDVDNDTAGYYVVQLLNHATPDIVVDRFALMKTLPRHNNDNIQFSRPVPYEPALIPLREGVTPEGNVFQYERVYARVQQFGDYSLFSDDRVDYSKRSMMLQESAQIHGEQIALTREKLLWKTISNGTGVSRGAGATARNTLTTTGNILSLIHI